MVFFAIGAAALSGSILCDDLIKYYQNKRLLEKTEISLKQLQSLNDDYDALLKKKKKDPNFIDRIAPVTLGTEPNEENTIYPKVSPEQLALARKALTKDDDSADEKPILPEWLARSSEPRRRLLLFIAGGVLILVSFACFGPVKEKIVKV